MTTRQSPRSAVLLALILGVGGVGLVVSGILLLSSGGDGGVAATTSLPAPATTTTAGQPGTTVGPGEVTTTTAPEAPVHSFVTLTDDSGSITIDVPADWVDVSTSEWTRDGTGIGPSIGAAVDIPAWVEGWDTPGLFVGVTDRMGPEEAHGDFSGACLHDRSEATSAGGHTGTGDWWWWCGDQGTSFFVAVLDLGQGRIALFQILDSPEGLPGVVEQVLASFRYQG